MPKRTKTHRSFQEAAEHLVGGVNSPVRAFRAVGGEPFFVERAEGSKLVDTEGRAYLDYVLSWGALILGHAHPDIVAAVKEAAGRGTSYGAPTPGEVELAKLVKDAFPSVAKIRFVSSGTEAVMSAVRLARGFTGRKKIVKFAGCYHGHSDALLVRAGSGGATFGIPDSAGVPEELARLTVNLPYNGREAVEELFENEGSGIACVLVEPAACNMGLVPPEPGFLETLRDLCTRHGAVLIFDEVITGFRLAFGGAQELFGVEADLTCLGKILGGGLPMAAFGGKPEIMRRLAPEGDVYQAGTLSGNPVATACGIRTLQLLREGSIYRRLEEKASRLISPLRDFLSAKGFPVRLHSLASLFTFFFTPGEVRDFDGARSSDTGRYAEFFRALLEEGIFFPPSQFEACFLSAAHSDTDIDRTVRAIRSILLK